MRMTGRFHVAASHILTAERSRRSFDMDAGQSIQDVIDAAIPQCEVPPSRVRVVLSGDAGDWEIAADLWHCVRPKPGVQVTVRTIPGQDQLRSVLTVVVSAAAVAFAPGLVGALPGTFTASLATAAFTVVGTLLVNALIPAQVADRSDEAARNTYTINGWRNEARPNGTVPMVLGRMRYAPPFAASTYSEIVGDQQFVRALFMVGHGPVRISDFRIGETPIDKFNDIDIEVREGLPDDDPVTLYPRQVLEETLGLQLTRPFPRDDAGEIIEDAPSEETPQTSFTATDASEASVILGFPTGLFRVSSKGKLRSQSVTVRIRMRLNGGHWTEVETLQLTGQNREPMYRQHTWALPSRGRWEIEVTRMTDELTATDASDSVVFSALQSIRPEYPLNFDEPVALIAVRVRATYQLSGTLDNLNALIERKGPVHLGNGVWGEDYSRNAATAYMIALQGQQNPYPATDDEIDLQRMGVFYDFCFSRNLTYDRIHDEGVSLGEMLTAIAAAGRAAPRHDGIGWHVLIDRPDDLIVEHINDRNADTFSFSSPKFDPPDAFRVRFFDETNNYAPAERIIPWPGHVGPIVLTEELALPGVTSPDQVWLAARRRQYELMHRSVTYSAMQSGRARVAQRGDMVRASLDVLESTLVSARVKSVSGSLVELDASMPASNGFAIRFKSFDGPEDLFGVWQLREIADRDYDTNAVRILDPDVMPEVGEAVAVGPLGQESRVLRIKGLEAAENGDARVIMVDAAPIIDELLDAEVPPAWDGRVGAEVAASVLQPAVPVFVHVRTGVDGTGVQNGVEVLVKPGAGSSAVVTSYEIDHRLAGGAWTTISVPAASASLLIEDYALEDDINIRARAIATNTASDDTAVVTVKIGADDPDIPGALDISAIDVLGSLGRAVIGVGVPPDNAIAQLQFYRSPEGVALDRDAHAVQTPVPAQPGATVSFTDGDATRTTLINNGGFNTADNWEEGVGWTISGGEASHSPGVAGDLSRDVSLDAGATYRISFEVAGRTAGSVTPQLTGGTAVSGAAVSANGLNQLTLVAQSGNTQLTFAADATFDGSVDDVIIFRETAACVDAGSWDYWIEPQNDVDVAGPIAGPFTTIIF